MSRVIFIRHALPVNSYMDDRSRPLTLEGLNDRSYIVDLLKDEKIDLFYCSPYKRSIQTIETLAAINNKTIHIDERFRERVNGKGEINASTIYQRWQDLNYHEEDGESLQQLQDRNIEALHELLHRYPDQTIVIGTHGSALSMIIHYYHSNFNYDSFMRIKNWMPYIVEMEFVNTELNSFKELGYLDKNQ